MNTVRLPTVLLAAPILAWILFQATTTSLDIIRTEAPGRTKSSEATPARLIQREIHPADYLPTAKRLVIFKKILPPHQRIAVFYSDDCAAIIAAREAAERLGVELVERHVKTVGELKAALGWINTEPVDGIFHIPDALIAAHMGLVLREANRNNIPTMTYDESYLSKGALVAYGIGTQGRPYELILNLDTGRQIGFDFPQTVLNRADKIVAGEAG